MIIGRSYLLKKSSGPSSPKLFLDTRIIPGVVNMAGAVEVALDRASLRTGIRPAVLVAGTAGIVLLILTRLVKRRM